LIINKLFVATFFPLGHLYMIRAFLPPMLEMNHGSIVAIAAVCGHMGMPNMIPYAASKFGVRGMMESLYIELRCVTF
jgi:short-subunit dehydrogenase